MVDDDDDNDWEYLTDIQLRKRQGCLVDEVEEKRMLAITKKNLIKFKERAAKVVDWEWEGKTNKEMAVLLGMTHGGFVMWKANYRHLLDAEYDKLNKKLEHNREMARLKAKDKISRKLDKAIDAVDSCLEAKSEAVRSRTAFKVLDRIDPVSTKQTNVAIGIFSAKTAGLLQSASCDLEAESVELLESGDDESVCGCNEDGAAPDERSEGGDDDGEA